MWFAGKSIRSIVNGLAVLTLTIAGLVAAGSPASASKAELIRAEGVNTLLVIGEKGERNRIHIQLEADRRHFTLRDTGQVPDYSDVILSYSPTSLPGCSVESMGDERTHYLRCEIGAVKRIALDLRDKDDLVQNGDGIQRKTQLNRTIEAKLGGGVDIFNGGPAGDMADGGAGNDILKGWGNHDLLIGGRGQDSLAGDGDYSSNPPRGGGHDMIFGGPARDFIAPGSGRDRVYAGSGNDIVSSVVDRDRDIVDCGGGRNDSLLGVNSRGIRFRETSIAGCETVGSGRIGKVWTCSKRRCVVHRSRPVNWR